MKEYSKEVALLKRREKKTHGKAGVPNVQTGHTPGPWDDCSRNDNGSVVRIFAKSKYIGSIESGGFSPEETAANAAIAKVRGTNL